ncbi:MAG: penicillin-binding protein 1C [Bacteroidales bacterium]|nr:penicillin-binding protein 1C [Bacteroidales bacterium]
MGKNVQQVAAGSHLLHKKWQICVIGGLLLLLLWLFVLPQGLFRDTVYSTVVESAEGELLGARIAADGQWRFPPQESVPERFATALIQFEDRRFRWHPGVDVLAIGRALKENTRSGHVVSGGSTITMQVIRISRGKERTLWQKVIEAVEAVRLECRHSKKYILAQYAAHAPFGGNVVGLEAAAWRYFGVPAGDLSWGESALLAVLPNAPSSLHPGKGREELLEKRNRLLLRLLEHGDIDNDTYNEAVLEPLPDRPVALPSYASHYVQGCPEGVQTRSTIQLPLQRAVEEAVRLRSDALAAEGVADMAAVVIDNSTGEVVAYVGNSSPERQRPGSEVDIARSPRSTGSILKPLLYEAALEDGTILPGTLLPDIPVNLNGFAPQNFDREFYGAVPANEALSRSLNVPAVFLLRSYGVPRFYDVLVKAGLTTLTHDASHYGLSLILGGAECTLLDITMAYSGMVRDFSTPLEMTNNRRLAIWYTLEALKEVNRPDQLDWRLIGSVRKAAWKTGTSYGFRDAWAVGMIPAYTIGVWAGNAEGEGVPGLTGARAAGPVMFDILNLLPSLKTADFEDAPPSGRSPVLKNGQKQGRNSSGESGGVVWADVCKASGHLAGPECPETVSMQLPERAMESAPCPYHKGGAFVLPPSMEWYYRPHHPEYTGAGKASGGASMEFIYPSAPGSVLRMPARMGTEEPGIVFRVAHRDAGTTLWWHMDGAYVGETRLIHEIRLSPAPGRHRLTVTDASGETISTSFTCE